MKHHAVLLLLLILAGASAQELVAVVPLPDSIIGLKDPSCVVVADSGRRVVVAGAEGWAIAIDCATNTKSGRVAIDPGTAVLCANGSGTKVYCAHNRPYPYQDSMVTVIDAKTLSVRGRVNVGKRPRALAWNERLCQAYVANSSSASVSVLCGQGDTLIATWPVRPNPVGIICSEGRNRLYVWHWQDRWLSVLDAATGTLIDTVNVGQYPSACVIKPGPASALRGIRFEAVRY